MEFLDELWVEFERVVARGVWDAERFEEEHRHEGVLLAARFALQARAPATDKICVVEFVDASVDLAPVRRHSLDHRQLGFPEIQLFLYGFESYFGCRDATGEERLPIHDYGVVGDAAPELAPDPTDPEATLAGILE